MLKTTFIARASDGLILCETYSTESNTQGKFFLYCQQLSPLFLILNHRLDYYCWTQIQKCYLHILIEFVKVGL